MKFIAAMWKLLVGVKDALVLILLLFFFGFLYVGLSAHPAPVRDGVLDLSLDGAVVEQPERARFRDVAGAPATRQYSLRSLVNALHAAKTDDRVKAVALDLDRFTGGGQEAMITLADAVRDVRSAGKPVLAYATGYTDDSYQVAAAASQVWLNPLGGVLIAGPGGTNLYFKGLLDKLGVTANVYRVGTYKSAVEPFIRSDMSPDARANAQALADAELEHWREAVTKSRPKAKVDVFLKDMNGAIAASNGNMAQAALAAGLVDKVADRSEFEAQLAKLGGEGDKTSAFKRIALAPYVRDTAPSSSGAQIAVVPVAGMIVDGAAGAGTAGGDTISNSITRAVADGAKAIVLRIDSPGGSVTASERIRQALVAAKAKGVKIVVSMGNVAASGGYWISTPADFIYAEPSTITGSIGVFGVIPSFQGTLQKLGIGADGVKTTPLSGEPDVLKGPSPEASQLIQTGIDATYRTFLGIVAKSRHKTPEQVDAIAQGRVWDGGTARQIGLIDGFGGFSDAVAKAATLANLGDDRTVRYYEPPTSIEEEIASWLANDDNSSANSADAFAFLTLRPQQQMSAAIADVQALLSGPAIQVRCVECAAALPPPAPSSKVSDAGFLSVLAGLLRL